MSQEPVDIVKSIVQRILNTTLYATILGAIGVTILLFFMCFTLVKPYEYGVKQINIPWFFGMTRGIQEKVYAPGWHFVMPFSVEKMHRFPRNIQEMDLTSNPNRSIKNFFDKSAYIQTSDGFFVDVDVTIMFRIKDPIKVIRTIGLGDLYYYNGLLPKAEPILKDSLGTLTTEEFYNPYLRVEKMLEARDQMNADLSVKGIEVEHVLIRYFKYSDEIQKNIEEKKLQDQLVFRNQAEARAAMEEAQLAKIIQEGEASVKVELEKGRAYQKTRDSEKDLYVRTQRAKGDLLIKKAEAEKVRLKNNALRGVGSQNLVGLEMAKVLKGVEWIMLPSDGDSGLNPLNLEKTRRLFE